MDQVVPGIYHWTGPDVSLRVPAHSYYVEPAGALIDPIVPAGGLDPFAGFTKPQQVILTNHRHFRDSDRFARVFGVPIRVAEPGAAALTGYDVEPFSFGEEVAYGVTAIKIGRLSADETALHITHGSGAIALGDALVHPEDAPIAYASDDMLGDDPVSTRKDLKNAFTAMLPRDFDALLFAHGAPIPKHAKTALRRFVELPTEYPEFGPFGTRP
jgi:hypothetical protein